MIVEIPTSKDFEESAGDLLQSAFDQVSELLIEFNEMGGFAYESHDEEFDESDYKRYWQAAKQTIITSYAMVQQGVEFYIKGRIASVSPYLLLSGNPSSWPKKCDQNDVPFSSFRTVDAQDLIRLHDTVYNEKFSNEFRQWYEEMRTSRNKIMHTVDKRLHVQPEDLLEAILYAHQYFCGQGSWLDSRFSYLDGTPAHSIRYIREHDGHKPYVMLQVLTELGIIVGKLTPAKIKGFFGFDKKKHSYNCPSCYEVLSNLDYFEPGYHDESFKPYQKNSEEIFVCCVCKRTGILSGESCFEDDCDSSLVDDEKGMCLVCGAV
ncbi:MAG TPA: hypothetical protein VIM93_11350 [Kangiella sp.]